ncbi:MAG: glycosyltransferase family 4 protein [Pseudomonadota bacterium]
MTEASAFTQLLVIVAPDIGAGGSVSDIALRHAHLLSSQFRVHIVTRSVPAHLPAHIGRTLVQPVNWNWLRRFCHVPNELAFALSARRAILDLHSSQGSVDAIWCHGHSIAALAGAPLKVRVGAAMVATVHGDIFDRPRGTYSRELTALYEWSARRTHAVADAIHAISPKIAEAAIRHGAPAEHVHTISHGIDPEEVGLLDTHPRAVQDFMEGGRLRLLYVGALLPVKGVDVLVRAAAAVTSHPVELVLAGDGPEKKRLEMLAHSLGVNTTFLGAVPRNELGKHYRRADIVCVPSLSEALSLATLEAMVCGTPVVASNTGGIPSLITHGRCGLLAEAGDAFALGECLSGAASSPEYLATLGAQGWARARRDFSWPVIGKQLEALALTAIESARMRKGPG